MKSYKYLIVGGGMAADAAVKGIREMDASGSICLISAEEHPPYKRPPLSKKLWKGAPEDSIWLNTESHDVSMVYGRRVVKLDLAGKRAVDEEGSEYAYQKLLLATGGSPRRLPIAADEIIYFRTLDDYRRVRNLCSGGENFVVFGGGFIGSEIAAALAMVGKRVTMVFPETGIGARMFPRELSNFLVEYYRERGVEVLSGDVPVEVNRGVVRTQAGRQLPADGIAAGIGIIPETRLAADAGLAVDEGILVDPSLRTTAPDVFAAGDVARFHNPVLDRRMRVEHEDNAVTMGLVAGRNMAGANERYDHLPYFYSDMFDLGYEAVGEVDVSACTTFSDWKEPFREGVVYYLRDGRVRGVLLWNVWDKVPEARLLIGEPGPFEPEDLEGRITG